MSHVFRRRNVMLVCLIASMILSLAKLSVPVSAPSESRVYVEMPPEGYINGTGTQDTVITVDVYVENAVDLVQWALSVQVDPNVLEVKGAQDDAGTVIYDYVDSINWEPGEIWAVGSVDKTEGKMVDITHVINAWDELENASIGPGTGFNGSGKLCTLGFKVLNETEYSPIDLYDVRLYDGLYWETGDPHSFPPDIVEDGHFNPPPSIEFQFPVTVDEWEFNVVVESNSTVSDFDFRQGDKEIRFSVTGTDGTVGFCNVTIPMGLMKAIDEPWLILVDGDEVTYTQSDNGTHTFLYFTYTHTTRNIVIRGTWVVPEFPTTLLLPLLIIVTLAAVILRKKLWSTKHRNTTSLP